LLQRELRDGGDSPAAVPVRGRLRSGDGPWLLPLNLAAISSAAERFCLLLGLLLCYLTTKGRRAFV